MDDDHNPLTSHSGFHPLFFPLNLATELELLLSGAIVCILLAVAAAAYRPYIHKADVIQAIGGADFEELKRDVLLFHSIEGTWPRDNAAALQYSWIDAYGKRRSDAVKNAFIADGAIHFELKGPLQGRILTARPGCPAGDALGPVIWVVGENAFRGTWALAGENRTTVDDRYIPRALR